MRVLTIGDRESAQILTRGLRKAGVDSFYQNVTNSVASYLKFIERLHSFDVVLGFHLGDCFRFIYLAKMFRKAFVLAIIGGDGFRYLESRGIKRLVLKVSLLLCDKRLFVTEQVKEAVGMEGTVFPIPIDAEQFKHSSDERIRDILYYCPRPDVYQLDWIIRYAQEHLHETITVLGYVDKIPLENVTTVSWVDYEDMPKVYQSHKRLIRMTLYDGHPKMIYEALLCGCEVVWNGEPIKDIPEEMLVENAIPRLIEILKGATR